MLFYGMRALPRGFRLILNSFQQSDSVPFSDVLTQEQIEEVCEQHGVLDDAADVFTIPMVIWGFLFQVLHKEEARSCLAAVAQIGVLLIACGRPRCSYNTGAYCRARQRVPVEVVKQLTLDVASRSEARIPEDWLWKNRHVKLIDGTTATMPDTEENQEVFPQLSRQKRGLGFPIVRMVVLLSLATAMVEGMEMAPYSGKQTGELALLRELLDQFNPGDVALCDKLYCSYFMLALLLDHKVDVVTLLHQARKVDTRQGKRLGRGDHLITFQRPSRPTWMTPETYAQIPKKIELRMIRVRINEPGFRTESLTIITTLTDAKQYSRDEIAELYRRRWLAELDIRAIKSTMGMDHLRCKTPDMVRKEIWTCLLAYNLIRLKILQSAMKKDISPRSVSFTGALQVLAAGWMTIQSMDQQTQHVLIELMLESIASQKVGKRPGRTEPRAVKRRPKPFRLLTMPRQEARDLLLAGINPYQKKK